MQPNSNPLHIDQIKGRLQRLAPGQLGKLIILCARDTQDESWLNKGLARIPDEKIKSYILPESKYWK